RQLSSAKPPSPTFNPYYVGVFDATGISRARDRVGGNRRQQKIIAKKPWLKAGARQRARGDAQIRGGICEHIVRPINVREEIRCFPPPLGTAREAPPRLPDPSFSRERRQQDPLLAERPELSYGFEGLVRIRVPLGEKEPLDHQEISIGDVAG